MKENQGPAPRLLTFRSASVAVATVIVVYMALEATVGQLDCRPDVSCETYPELCSDFGVPADPACGVFHPPKKDQPPDEDAVVRVQMFKYLQDRVPIYLDGGTHLGSIRNASMIASDGDMDAIIAPRYKTSCAGGYLGMAQRWWFDNTRDEIYELLNKDLPDGWYLHRPGSYDFTLSLTPDNLDPKTDKNGNAKCCKWPHAIDINVESHCRQAERQAMFGDGWCPCFIDGGQQVRCVRNGEKFARCQYGVGWRHPEPCTYSPDHPSKPPCDKSGNDGCDHRWWYQCPFIIGYKYRRIGGW